jgi:hypothetical protein
VRWAKHRVTCWDRAGNAAVNQPRSQGGVFGDKSVTSLAISLNSSTSVIGGSWNVLPISSALPRLYGVAIAVIGSNILIWQGIGTAARAVCRARPYKVPR